METRIDSSVFLRRCATARKRLLWSRLCTPLSWRVNATARQSAHDHRASNLRLRRRVRVLVMLVMLVFAARHAVTPRGSLASGVVDADAVPFERASIALGQRCLVASFIAAALAARPETAEPETLSSFSALALLAAADHRGLARSRASPRRDAWREGFRRAPTPPEAPRSTPPSASALFSSAPGELSESSDKPPPPPPPPPRRALAAKAPPSPSPAAWRARRAYWLERFGSLTLPERPHLERCSCARSPRPKRPSAPLGPPVRDERVLLGVLRALVRFFDTQNLEDGLGVAPGAARAPRRTPPAAPRPRLCAPSRWPPEKPSSWWNSL